ncbi:murein L,D-transpeptidase family protein [Caenimonas sp. SL110]|uniref:L,D-transpeptidase family protein n=1 Tax=Caenimonas sp. SL110 TaxID=1450524 RepID=UPI0006538885|nr:L,D-transpeptidase family protein [Caenimonas sp. SL110]
MKPALLALCCVTSMALLATLPAQAAHGRKHASKEPAKKPVLRDGDAEVRLIEVYRLLGQAKSRDALARAESLVKDHPNFQLAQLVYGDLLAAQARPVRMLGDVAESGLKFNGQLAELREESQLRLRALRERPPPDSVPAQFLQLSPQNRHAIAIDTSRARLYLFENTSTGLKLLADYYISVGKSGVDKSLEGDLRTPLGVYFVTSNLDPKSLKDFYGAGALPINYPNAYDARRGKTGSGIWLHGSPPSQFARAPKATDGCVVLANPDLQRVIRTVAVRTTPVVIASSLNWVAQHQLQPESQKFAGVLQSWRAAKASGDPARLLGFYAADFNGNGKSLAEWAPTLKQEADRSRGRNIQMKDLSYLHWSSDRSETMVVTFGEVTDGDRTGPVKRQYWLRQGTGSGSQWKIFFEGVIG